MAYCAKCDSALPPELKISRQSICPSCNAYLHACIQCRFHEPSAHNQCLEPQAEYVGNREKANFCDFFQLAGGSGGGGEPRRAAPGPVGADHEQRAKDARAKLEALFKKPEQDE